MLIDGEIHRVNLELVVDTASDAAVGIAVSDQEDSQAVKDAFDSGVQTTAEQPLAGLTRLASARILSIVALIRLPSLCSW